MPLIKPSPFSIVPPPGTPAGDQKRREFIAGLLALSPDTRQLWVPNGTDTTTSTSVDLNARTITWDATLAARYSVVGSGHFVSFNGTSNYGTSPDAANMSFGDGTTDMGFSIYAWLNMTASASNKTIFARDDLTTGATNREYSFYLGSNEGLYCDLFDDSASGYIGRGFGTAIGAGANMLVVMTYSGSRVNAGCRLYVFDGTNAGQVDNANDSAGSYTAMENKSGLTYIGASEGTNGAAASLFGGSMGANGCAAKMFTADDVQTLRQLGNAYYGLTV